MEVQSIELQKVSKKVLEQARNLYFSNKEINEICYALSIEPETLRFYIFGIDGDGKSPSCWSNIRKKLNPTVYSQYLKSKIDVLESVSGLSLELVTTSLTQLRDAVRSGEKVLNVDEISKLAKVAVDMDKIVRLESGQATELINHMGLSRAEAREILENDPFAKDVEVEFTELPWLNEGESNVE